jgi:hypothetical protein
MGSFVKMTKLQINQIKWMRMQLNEKCTKLIIIFFNYGKCGDKI